MGYEDCYGESCATLGCKTDAEDAPAAEADALAAEPDAFLGRCPGCYTKHPESPAQCERSCNDFCVQNPYEDCYGESCAALGCKTNAEDAPAGNLTATPDADAFVGRCPGCYTKHPESPAQCERSCNDF